MRALLTLVGLLVALDATVLPAAASEDGGGRSVLNESAGTRGALLGNAFTALSDDASGPLWNPAGLGFIERQELQASHADLYGSGLGETFVGAVLPSWRWGVLGLTYRHFGVSGIEGRDDRNVVTDTDLSDSEDQVAFSYARPFGEAWSLGGTVKVRRQSLAGASASGLGADLGLQLRPGLLLLNGPTWLEETRLGISFQNVVKPSLRLDRENVPDQAVLRVGVAQAIRFGGERQILAAIDLEQSPDMRARVHAGAELRLHSALSVGAGIDDGALTAGTSLRWRDLSVNYSMNDRDLGAVQNFGISFHFGATVDARRQAALDAQEVRLQTRLAEAFDRRQNERIAGLLAAADSAVAERNFDAALQSLGVLNTLAPGQPRAAELEADSWRGRGAALEAEGAWTDAALAYARALDVAPGDSLAATGLRRSRDASDAHAARTLQIRDRFSAGLDAFSRGDLVVAQDTFRGILADEPADAEAARMLERTRDALVRRTTELLAEADQLVRGGQFDPAAQRLAQVRQLSPGLAELSRAENDLARARRAAEEQARSATASGRNVAPTTGAATASGAATRAGSSEPTTLSPQRRREVEDLYDRGLEAVRAGRADEALRYWEMVHVADPGHAQVRDYLKREYLMRGMDAYAAGRLTEAVDFWQKVLAVDPGDRKAGGYLARARQQLTKSNEILGGTR